MKPIHLFERGSEINEGDLLRARIDSVEGHRRVTLEKIGRVCPNCLHGTQRDVETIDGEYLGDIECYHCNGTGILIQSEQINNVVEIVQV